MLLVLGLCDPIHVLARGACICSGRLPRSRPTRAVLDAYLGDDYLLEREAA